MRDSSPRSVLTRCLGLAAALALVGSALLLPAVPAHAFPMAPACPIGNSTYTVYYNNAQHQQVVGTRSVACNNSTSSTGTVSGFFTETCTPCS